MTFEDQFDEACDMYHPDYGWIRKDNKTTEEGLKFFKDQREKLNGEAFYQETKGNC